ncbi:MAG: hypothetical protein ACXVHQ_35155 [Solirubrobacteraceae bacterium]
MTRREVIRVAVIGLAAIAAAVLIGLTDQGPWPQLAVVVIAAVLVVLAFGLPRAGEMGEDLVVAR